MCEPTTLMAITLAMSAASAGLSYVQGKENAQTQAENIKTATGLQQMDLERQAEQQRQQAAQQMNEQAKQAQRDAALFDVITGEYGGGNTADRSRVVAGVQQGEQLATIAGNASGALAENRFASLATATRANAQLSTIQQPSLFGTALKIGADSVNAYAGYKRANMPPKT